jgi:hypothetical protein
MGVGALGVYSVVTHAPTLLLNLPPSTWALTAAIFLLLLVIFAGQIIAARNIRTSAGYRYLAIAAQAIQIPAWTVTGSAFSLIPGLFVGPMLHEKTIKLFTAIGLNVQIRWADRAVSPVIALNVIPMLAIVATLFVIVGEQQVAPKAATNPESH